MLDFQYLKTKPGICAIVAVILDNITFVCLLCLNEIFRALPAARGLLVVIFFAGFATKFVIAAHTIPALGRKIPPYPFAILQVALDFVFSLLILVLAISLITEFKAAKDDALLVFSTILSFFCAFAHIAHVVYLLMAIRVTRVAREAMGFSEGGSAAAAQDPNTPVPTVSYSKDETKETVTVDPTQAVY